MLSPLLSLLLTFSGAPAPGGVVTVKHQRFEAEVAQNDPERAKGLMNRFSLPSDHCMFFVYPLDGFHPIWMKNCFIYLDVAWVSADGTIQELVEEVPPCPPRLGDDCPTFGGSLPTRHFVEFPAGTFKRLGIRKGDRLGWELHLEGGRTLVGGAAQKARRE